MASQIKFRRGTASQWTSTNPVLSAGEPGFETDTGQFKIGDGTTAWNSLAYAGGASEIVEDTSPQLGGNLDLNSNNITGTGNITIAGNITPTTDVTYDLGSSSYRWRDLYLSGSTIDLGGAQIKTDDTTGAIAFVPPVSAENPNPSALVVSPTGTISVATTSAGTIDSAIIQNASPTSPPKISAVAVTDSSGNVLDDTAVDLAGGYIRITGANFVSGCQVLFGNTEATSTTFVSSTTLRCQLPAASAGSYILYVVNPDGAAAVKPAGVTFSASPSWTTNSTLTAQKNDTAFSLQLSATDATTYSLQAGSSLPANVTLSSGGLLSGTVSGLSNDTLYTFTVVASDNENQDSPRTFNLNVTVSSTFIKMLSREKTTETYFPSITFYDASVDSNDNIYACGYTYTGNSGQGNSHGVVAKFNKSGTMQWIKQFAAWPSVYFYGIYTKADGTTVVVGQVADNAYGITVVLDSSGAITWAKGYGTGQSGSGNYYSTNYAATVDSGGNVISVGLNRSAYSPIGGGIVRKYNSSGTVQWSKDIEETDNNNQQFFGVVTDSSNNIYCVGITQYQAYGDETHIYVVKLNSSGAIQWQKGYGQYGGTSYKESGYGIDIDSSGNLYLSTMNYQGAPVLLKINGSNGTRIWARKFETGMPNSSITPIRPSDAGTNVKVSGNYVYWITGADWGGSGGKLLLSKYDLNGNIQWKRTLDDTTTSPRAYGINIASGTVSYDGNYVVAVAENVATENNRALIVKVPIDGSETGTYGNYVYAAATYAESADNANTELTGYPTVNLSAQDSHGSEVSYSSSFTITDIAANISQTNIL